MSAVIGLLLGLGFLMFMAYRGFSVIFFAPVFALMAAAFSGLSVMPAYTELFLPSMAGYVKTYFPFFLLGAVFGKSMEYSGAAEAIAGAVVKKLGTRNAIPAIVLSCAILTYGGVSLFVVAFAVYPFAASLFRQADLPKRLLPGTIALGAFTFTMDALPGTPQIQNAIPMKFFNTDLYAAPVFGTLGAALVLGFGLTYLLKKAHQAKLAGEGYGVVEPEASTKDSSSSSAKILHPLVASLPLVCVLAVTLILQKVIFPQWNILEWATQAPYNMNASSISGSMNNWALMIALTTGIVIALFLNPSRVNGKIAILINAGAAGSLLAVMNTASEVGFGHVIKSLPGFSTISQALMSIGQDGSPLLSEAISVNVLSGITGSASGGMSIALDTFGAQYLEWANRVGVNPQLLHRVAAMASGGMDTLPHNGAVITLLAITGLTHRQSYRDIFAITLIKTATVFVLIGLSSLIHFV